MSQANPQNLGTNPFQHQYGCTNPSSQQPTYLILKGVPLSKKGCPVHSYKATIFCGNALLVQKFKS